MAVVTATITDGNIAQWTLPSIVADAIVALNAKSVDATCSYHAVFTGGPSPTRMTGAGVDSGAFSVNTTGRGAGRFVTESALVTVITKAIKGFITISMNTARPPEADVTSLSAPSHLASA